MKQIEILTAFGIGKPNTTERMHAKTLSEIFAMIASMLCNIMSVVIESREFHFGQIWDTPIDRDAKPFSEGTKMEGEKWIVKTKTGTYSFSLPTGNLFYFAFCDLLKNFVPGYMKKEIQAEEITRRNKTFAAICYLAFGCFVALMAYIFSGMAVYAS